VFSLDGPFIYQFWVKEALSFLERHLPDAKINQTSSIS
jgi:hypothetical protein